MGSGFVGAQRRGREQAQCVGSAGAAPAARSGRLPAGETEKIDAMSQPLPGRRVIVAKEAQSGDGEGCRDKAGQDCRE